MACSFYLMLAVKGVSISLELQPSSATLSHISSRQTLCVTFRKRCLRSTTACSTGTSHNAYISSHDSAVVAAWVLPQCFTREIAHQPRAKMRECRRQSHRYGQTRVGVTALHQHRPELPCPICVVDGKKRIPREHHVTKQVFGLGS